MTTTKTFTSHVPETDGSRLDDGRADVRAPIGLGWKRVCRRLSRDENRPLRDDRPHRLRANRHGARARLLQEVRHRFDRFEGSVVGRHPRQDEPGRKPGHAHAPRHADRVDDGAGGIAGEADGDSVAAESQRSGDHAQQQAEAGRRQDRKGCEAARRQARKRPANR